jgi:ribonuclease BN (tRNA processing enzyme)
MHLRVLGCAGSEFPGHHSPGFLIDRTLLLDAGTIGAVLSEHDQWLIRNILLSHCHLDHIKGIPLLADNIITRGVDHTIRLVGTAEILNGIRQHLFNNVIWPDFSLILSKEHPVVEYHEIKVGQKFSINEYTVLSIPVNHSIPAVGYILRKGNSALLYTGDTGPTDLIWQSANDLSAVIVEASFPNGMEKLALLTGHLTPSMLRLELDKLQSLPPIILVTHPKPQYYKQIQMELRQLNIPQLDLLQDGNEYEL